MEAKSFAGEILGWSVLLLGERVGAAKRMGNPWAEQGTKAARGWILYLRSPDVPSAPAARQCQALLPARPPPVPPGSADAVLIITRMYFRAGYLFSLLMMCKSG